jgi:hypothetical protein
VEIAEKKAYRFGTIIFYNDIGTFLGAIYIGSGGDDGDVYAYERIRVPSGYIPREGGAMCFLGTGFISSLSYGNANVESLGCGASAPEKIAGVLGGEGESYQRLGFEGNWTIRFPSSPGEQNEGEEALIPKKGNKKKKSNNKSESTPEEDSLTFGESSVVEEEDSLTFGESSVVEENEGQEYAKSKKKKKNKKGNKRRRGRKGKKGNKGRRARG